MFFCPFVRNSYYVLKILFYSEHPFYNILGPLKNILLINLPNLPNITHHLYIWEYLETSNFRFYSSQNCIVFRTTNISVSNWNARIKRTSFAKNILDCGYKCNYWKYQDPTACNSYRFLVITCFCAIFV